MMVGNASAGVVVVAVAALIRAAAGGSEPTAAQLRLSARVCFGVLVASSAGCAALYAALRRATLLIPPPHTAVAAAAASASARVDGAPGGSAPSACSLPTLCERLRALRAAARAAGLPACCQLLVFGATLTPNPDPNP